VHWKLPAGFVIGAALYLFWAKSAVTMEVMAIEVARAKIATVWVGSELSSKK